GWPEQTPEMKTYYPGNLLCTAREIITLWVSRMVMMGQYCAGDIPFSDVYIHAMIQDGLGRKMSKSLGNGIDPLDIIDSHGADAMRFTLASMTTDTQDVRMPVEEMTLPDGRKANTSPKFDIGRNFCNKLWNASRFAMMNLEGTNPSAFDPSKMDITDRWILSRLAATAVETTRQIDEYKFNEPIMQIYRFFWNDLCDWYLEWIKPRMRDPAAKPIAQNVLAFVLDQTLRLLHPFTPFITEGIFQQLRLIAPDRRLPGIIEPKSADALIIAPWPEGLDPLIQPAIDAQIELVQNVIRPIREIRNQYNVPPKNRLTATAAAPADRCELLNRLSGMIAHLAGLDCFESSPAMEKPGHAATAMVGDIRVFVHHIIDPAAERQRLTKQKEQIESMLKGVQAKLGNPNFVGKAKPEVIEQARARMAELQGQLAGVEQHLSELESA
ncbi:MAG: class I tRNA ligase family protein, partial [Phycisphaerae bacterium]|nr:class I tRNA ligase family protein [Phycisphaerae bacterium]